MSVDNSYQPAVYKEQGGNKLVVKSGGTIEVAGTIAYDTGFVVTGYLPNPAALADGQYVLSMASGVGTWVLKT